jgi:hypothetical protein
MTRRHRGKSQLGVSLFPFLAVLICTMGALIVLLLLIMQQARVQAQELAVQTPSAEELAAAAAELQIKREDAQWRREALENQRAQGTQQLADQRLALAHLEDHIRRLQEHWRDLELQAEQLQSQGQAKESTRDNVQAQIAAAREEIKLAQSELAAAQAAARQKPRSYSLIPYEGPNGTSRRPIYIECTSDCIMIQPEGVTLDARDFEGPLGPGNSLDACLRAIREYLARSPAQIQQGEPYPLLVVRPSGVVAYAAARSAMKSWDDEFGYELIEDDTTLAYPAPDPRLKALLERAIVEARQRQQLLAAAAPSRFRGSSIAGGRGGESFGGFSALFRDDPYINAASGGNGGSEETSPETGIGSGGGGAYSGGQAGSKNKTSRGADSPGGFYPPKYQGGRGQGQRTGQAAATGTAASGQGSKNGAPPPGATSVAMPGGLSGGNADSTPSTDEQAATAQPIAQRRGANWALRNYSQQSIGITRPVRVRVWTDKLEILPERGTKDAARTVAIDGSMSEATQRLVEQMDAEVETWGIAFSNGYWKPVLTLETAPGAEYRARELEALLEGSGLGIRRN